MVITDTPVEHYPKLGLYVKREDLCCPGGPNFSKTRGVYPHVQKRPEQFIGVLDTSHSQGGWAVAKACKLLGKTCVNFYPVRKGHEFAPLPPVQQETRKLGAQLVPFKSARSAILYHQAKKWMAGHWGVEPGNQYMMPNALKLIESVDETAAEFRRTKIPRKVGTIVVSASSGTLAAGVLMGAWQTNWKGLILVHMGYSRPKGALLNYLEKMAGVPTDQIRLIDEGYNYVDESRGTEPLPFSSNSYYDRKAAHWWLAKGRKEYGGVGLLWNIG